MNRKLIRITTYFATKQLKNEVQQKVLYGMEKLIYKNASAIVPLSVDMKTSIDGRYLLNHEGWQAETIRKRFCDIHTRYTLTQRAMPKCFATS